MYNPEFFKIKETNQGIEIIFKKERLAILRDKEIKLSQKFEDEFEIYFNEIATIIKMYLKYLGLWEERKKAFEILKEIKSKKILDIIKVKDAEILLWKFFYSNDLTSKEFFNNLLKNSPTTVKEAILKKYENLVYKLSYAPIIDIIILKAVDDINNQVELINITNRDVTVVGIKDETLKKFIEFLRKFEQKEVVRFLKKTFEENSIMFYIAKFLSSPKHFEKILMNS